MSRNISIKEALGMATKTLVSNKLRSSLTMLGIIIGNASVITLVGLGRGAQTLAKNQLSNSYILMGHSLGALIALLYEGKKPTDQLEEKCDSALKDFAITNLSKLLQCQLSEIPFPKKNNTNKASAIVGFNSFGSLVWPKENSTGIKAPTLLIGGTYDLITPLMNEQFRVFYALDNPLNRFLIIEGASHFSPIRINKSYEKNNDLFKISESFIGSEPKLVQDLSTKFIVEFLKNIKDQKIPTVVKNQRDLGLDFHLLDLETIKEISEN